MAKRRLIIALLTPLALMAAASSPTDIPVEGSVMSLEQCRQLALTNNKNLRRSAQQIKVAGYEKDQAFAAYLPAIDFAGGYMYNQKGVSVFSSDQLLPIKSFNLETKGYEFDLVKNPVDGKPLIVDGKPIPAQMAYLPKDALSYDLHNVFFGAVTLTQPIFMGGKIVAMNKITGYAEQLAEAPPSMPPTGRWCRSKPSRNLLSAMSVFSTHSATMSVSWSRKE